MANTITPVRTTAAALRADPEPKAAAANQPKAAPDTQPSQVKKQQEISAPRDGRETQQLQKQAAAQQAQAAQQTDVVHRVEESAKAARAELQGRIGTNVDIQA
jgi:hypothetical protein